MHSEYHSAYRWALPWHNAIPRVGEYPQKVMLRTHPWLRSFLRSFLIFCRFEVFCDVFDYAFIRYLKQWSQNNSCWKPPTLCDICWKCEIRWTSNASSASYYICEGSNHSLLETGSRLPLFIYLFIYLLFDWQRWATKHILQNSSTKKMSG